MNLLESYIFRKVAGATVLTFMALGAMVWLSQALRQFDLVTANGQAIGTFLHVSLLLVPVLVSIVFPVALMIAVLYTFNTMNNESELVVINASGASLRTLLKPVMLIGFIASLIVASMTLYFAPLSFSTWQTLITNVRGNIVTQFMREGTFMSLSPGLTFHMRSRNADGTLDGIFVSDTREDGKSTTYIAERGALLDNPLGLFMVMTNGTIQQRNAADQSISMIEFSSYAFDLSSFSAGGDTPVIKPNERPTTYLFNPDPNDPFVLESPGKLRAELNDRFTTPLYCFIFVLVPMMFLGQATSARQSRSANIAAAVLLATVIRAVPIFLPAETSLIAAIAQYAIPIGFTVLFIVLYLRGVQFRPPAKIVGLIETAFARASGLMGRTATQAAT